MPQALPREHPNFDFRLVEPTAMLGGVMDGETIPDFGAKLDAQEVGQRLATMNIEIVHYQMDGFGLHVLQGDLEGYLGELHSRTIRRGKGEMASRFRFYGTENIGGSATFVFVVSPRFASRSSRCGRSQVRVQCDGLSSKQTTGCRGL